MSVKCQKKFEEITINNIIADLSLAHLDPEMDIVVAYDASDYGIEVVLLHTYKEGKRSPINYN